MQTQLVTKHERILALLQEKKKRGADYMELAAITPRYGAVIHTLRSEGWDIETKKNHGAPGARYYLHGGGQRKLKSA